MMKQDTSMSNNSDDERNMEVDEEYNTSIEKRDGLSDKETRTSSLDHPFSIESILNGTTKRRKQSEKNVEENDALPLNALEEFTSKAFSTMKANHNNVEDEEAANMRDRLKLLPNKPPVTKKARRKARTCFTNQQIYELERRFLYQKYLSPQDRDELSEMLNLSNAQVITWFQNRRAKLKRDIEEMRNDVAAARTLQTRRVCDQFHCGRCTDCR